MANHKAIRAVSETLHALLQDRMVPGTSVSCLPPDVSPADEVDRRINLFLYRVAENASLKNQDIGAGDALSLNLHYLLTAHGKDEFGELTAHEVLGDAMQVLHENAIVYPAQRKTSSNTPVLSPELRDEIETIKISLDPLSVEDMTKIWTATTKPLRLSVAYTVSVVQIRGGVARRARLVGEPPDAGPRLVVAPLSLPRLEQIRVRRPGAGPGGVVESSVPVARTGDTLLVSGRGLGSRTDLVMLGSRDVTKWVTRLSDQRLTITLGDDPALEPGPLSLQVVSQLPLGEPPTLRPGGGSNVALVLLVPRVDLVTPSTSGPRTLTIEGAQLSSDRAIHQTIVGSTVLDETFDQSRTSTRLVVRVPDDVRGQNLVRVRVNGAESIDLGAAREVNLG